MKVRARWPSLAWAILSKAHCLLILLCSDDELSWLIWLPQPLPGSTSSAVFFFFLYNTKTDGFIRLITNKEDCKQAINQIVAAITPWVSRAACCRPACLLALEEGGGEGGGGGGEQAIDSLMGQRDPSFWGKKEPAEYSVAVLLLVVRTG